MQTTVERKPVEWTPTLALDMPVMDDTHEEFIALLAAAVQAPDDTLLSRWAELIDHTQEHFDREDQWMQATGFAADNCHATQHNIILQVMREGGKRGLKGELDLVRQMAHELGLWFANHVQSMDAGLALHMRSAGYDPATGQLTNPEVLQAEAQHGCAGSSCGTGESPSAPQQADCAA